MYTVSTVDALRRQGGSCLSAPVSVPLWNVQVNSLGELPLTIKNCLSLTGTNTQTSLQQIPNLDNAIRLYCAVIFLLLARLMLPKRGLEEITHKEQDKTEKGTHVANLISESTKKKKAWMNETNCIEHLKNIVLLTILCVWNTQLCKC